MVRKIIKNSDPILRQTTGKVEKFDFELEQVIDDMIATMRKANGVGLAAPQIGISKKILVCEFEGDKESNLKPFPLTVLCNPEIVSYSKTKINMVEGCLSFPGLEILVKRPKNVKVRGQDRYGKKVEYDATGLFSRVLQHENDHLNSTLLIDHIKETPIIYIGTGTLGAQALEALVADAQYRIQLVVTGNKSATSRTEQSNPIEMIAEKHKLPLLKTENINAEETIERIRKAKPKLGVMADFGQIIGPEILSIPKHGIINIHPSLLPYHRGASPIQDTILSGDKITGLTLILTANKMDAGPILSQASVRLSGSETSSILKEYLGKIGSTLLLNSIPYYLAGDLIPIPQEEKSATYSRLFIKEDGFVDEGTSTIDLDRKIRAFDIWPKVYTLKNGKRIQIIAGHFDENNRFVIDRVKPEGKNEMNYSDFTNGYRTTLTFKE